MVKGPAQLVSHRELFQVFVALLGHHEPAIAKVALECLFRFKPDFVLPYADKLKQLVSDKLRGAMIAWNEVTGTIPSAHRIKLVCSMARILFGRLSSKSGSKSSKDSPSARRISVFSFAAGFCATDDEIFPFVFLALRRYLPSHARRKPMEDFSDDDRLQFRLDLGSASFHECKVLAAPVHEGFLNVLEAIISQLGHRVAVYVPCFMALLLALLELFPLRRRPAEDDAQAEFNTERASRIRSLCYSRLADIFEKYASSFDFSSYGTRMWECLAQSLELLPQTTRSTEKVPPLLQLLVCLSRNSGVHNMLNETAIEAGFSCLSQSHSPAVAHAVLAFVENLLGTVNETTAKSNCPVLFKLLPTLLRHFELRFEAFGTSSSWKRELKILSNICVMRQNTANKTENNEFDSLTMLLVPFLHFNSRSSDMDRLHILDILESLIPGISYSSAASLYSKFSLLLGPFKSSPGFSNLHLRNKISISLKKLGGHHLPATEAICETVENLSSVNMKTMDDLDADTVLTALKTLGNQESEWSWIGLTKKVRNKRHLLQPLVRTCFHFLFNEDGVVARASFYALKDLIACARESGEGRSDPSNEWEESFEKFLEQSVVPMIRSGVCCKDAATRRFFILLVPEVAKSCESTQSPHLLGDLMVLISDQEPDLDFFLNVTHVQIHRRAKAFSRLRKLLLADDSEHGKFSVQSLAGIIYPIVLHPIYESKTKLEESLAMEAVATIGALARRFPWKKFQDELWTLLAQVDRQTQQERVGGCFLSTITWGLVCSLIIFFCLFLWLVYHRSNLCTSQWVSF